MYSPYSPNSPYYDVYREYSPIHAPVPAGLEPSCAQEALELIKGAVQGEREDELFYQYLISVASSREEQEIIASIRDDERKHNRMFRQIYRDFTGRELESGGGAPFARPGSYTEGLKQALFGELRAVEKYRKIRRCLTHGRYRDMLFEIITDELKHSAKYNYLFTLNSR
ncbi:MAG: ferritin-like domain-containing protein [Paenibacillus dendritiformis]|uniref:ferritin-like domain-containing protein n=1 Tax=Paenibacillus dendritiformis TaxID=130049 RepID=UPI001B03B61D|nr:ferritin-like domain-containing protein [Paenibacillus dendritiformis]MDU5142906.1 ferritin-like domain-containing protein [Paenibacillus dendritiformis]GIO73631.1 rubrerythrin [Paenibacillus dendritiformis]